MVKRSPAQLASAARGRSSIHGAAGRVPRSGSLCGDAAPAAAAAHGEGLALVADVVAPLAEAEALLSLQVERQSAPLDSMGSNEGTPVFRLLFVGSSRGAATTARLCCPPKVAAMAAAPTGACV